MKFSAKEAELITHALTYLSEGELLEENGWSKDDVRMLNNLIDVDFTLVEKPINP